MPDFKSVFKTEETGSLRFLMSSNCSLQGMSIYPFSKLDLLKHPAHLYIKQYDSILPDTTYCYMSLCIFIFLLPELPLQPSSKRQIPCHGFV